MADSKPLILITNDDGIFANGIRELAEIAKHFGKVVVFAPDSARSGQSNALTYNSPIRYKKISEEDGCVWHSCTGTPTDCVKLALFTIMRNQKPDMILSGINHGSNAAINILYSGTMGAVLEGCANNIPSIGFSTIEPDPNANLSFHRKNIGKIIQFALTKKLERKICLNVNLPQAEAKGIKFCTQADSFWDEEFEQKGTADDTYFTLSGKFVNREPNNENTDEWALANNYISIVPCTTDMTSYPALEKYNNIIL